MKSHLLAASLAVLTGCIATAAHAAPTTLDMNGLGWDISSGLQTQGYELRGSGGFSFIGNSGNCSPQCAFNGGNYVWSGAATIGVQAVGGAAFDLTSFDGAETHVGVPAVWAGSILVLGRYAGGGTVSTAFVLDRINDGTGPLADFQTFWLPTSFNNLTAVSFSVAGGAYGQFALDNIVLDSSFQSLSLARPAAVPEPGSLVLSGAALLLATAALQMGRSRGCGRLRKR